MLALSVSRVVGVEVVVAIVLAFLTFFKIQIQDSSRVCEVSRLVGLG